MVPSPGNVTPHDLDDSPIIIIDVIARTRTPSAPFRRWSSPLIVALKSGTKGVVEGGCFGGLDSRLKRPFLEPSATNPIADFRFAIDRIPEERINYDRRPRNRQRVLLVRWEITSGGFDERFWRKRFYHVSTFFFLLAMANKHNNSSKIITKAEPA